MVDVGRILGCSWWISYVDNRWRVCSQGRRRVAGRRHDDLWKGLHFILAGRRGSAQYSGPDLTTWFQSSKLVIVDDQPSVRVVRLGRMSYMFRTAMDRLRGSSRKLFKIGRTEASWRCPRTGLLVLRRPGEGNLIPGTDPALANTIDTCWTCLVTPDSFLFAQAATDS